MRICGAKFGQMFLYEGDGYRASNARCPARICREAQTKSVIASLCWKPLGCVTRTKQVAQSSTHGRPAGYEGDPAVNGNLSNWAVLGPPSPFPCSRTMNW